MNQQHTWPDVGAPGRDIWATAPRGTAIDASTKLKVICITWQSRELQWLLHTLAVWLD